jgi:hypothetical protein
LQLGLGRLQLCAQRGSFVNGAAKNLHGRFQSRLRNLTPADSHPLEVNESGQ